MMNLAPLAETEVTPAASPTADHCGAIATLLSDHCALFAQYFPVAGRADTPWDHIGHANDVVAMAAIDNKLFAATSDNRLWWRDPVR